jgi:HEAT repeat protein
MGFNMNMIGKLATLASVTLVTGMVTGCKMIDNTGNAISNMVSPPTPSEEARNVFNVYDPDIRRRALNNLSASSFGGEGPYVRLYRLLIDDPDPTVRAAAVKALGLHGEVKDVPLVCIRLADQADMVRWEASKALQKIHNPHAIKPLINGMNKDSDADVRMACADALGQYATPEVYGALVSALDDERYGVALAASKSLQTITGQELGDQASAWIKYRDNNGTNLFTNQKTYMWQPYTPPRGFMSKLQFWKEVQTKPAQAPVGLDENAS